MSNTILLKPAFISVIVAALTWVAPRANAVAITGSISFSGDFDAANGLGLPELDLTKATQFLSFVNCLVDSTSLSGDFVGAAGAGGSVNGFTFRPLGSPVNTVAQFNAGSTIYSFDLESLAITTDTSSLLEFDATGTAHMTGKEATKGTIKVTSTKGLLDLKGTSIFQFTADTVITQVPDSGTSMLLLGAALTGLGFLRRKLS